MAEAPMRKFRTWSPQLVTENRSDGSIVVRRADRLGPYPERITDRLEYWAREAPERTWMAARDDVGGWRTVSFGQALDRVQRIGQALLRFDLSLERPLLILSENSIEHGLIALAAQYIGVPFAAVSTAYSLVSRDYSKLKSVAALLNPGLVFVQEAERYAAAVDAVFPVDLPVVAVTGHGDRQILFRSMLETAPGAEVVAANAAVRPDAIAKFLFTSGTTGSPKAVIQTQRMLCANVEMATSCYEDMRHAPPVVVDWAPWSHVASGNQVFNMMIHNGGSFYIDDGRPTAEGIRVTARNLAEIAPTWYFNVPAGYEMLVEMMEQDTALARNFFSRLTVMIYAGASMAQHTWDRLNAVAVAATGERVFLGTGLGSTETCPFTMMCMTEQKVAGNVGIPAQAAELKLVPRDGRLEALFRGPHVTPGYWRDPDATRKAFDEEGFYRMGDALRFAVPGDAAQGFLFDGRLGENFKLRTGTWVSVGSLRATLIERLRGLVRDVVVAGEGRDEPGAILIPFLPGLKALIVEQGMPLPGSDAAVLSHPLVRDRISRLLAEHAAAATGSATRVRRVVFLDGEPSLDAGEVTDKGSINQRAVLQRRANVANLLFSENDQVIRI